MKEEQKENSEQKLLKQINEIELLDKLESMVIDNTIEFEIKKGEGKLYRVRMPTIREKLEINKNRLVEARKLQQAGFLYEKELKKELKEKQGIDVDKIDSKIISLTSEIESIQKKLVPEPNKDSRKKLKEIIKDLDNQYKMLIVEKSRYLESSIESQLSEVMITHFAALIYEKKVDKEWKRIFKDYNEFLDCTDTILVNSGINYTYTLLF